MDLFRKAQSIRLITHKDTFLTAEEDQQTVTHTGHHQDSPNTVWIVELEGEEFIRLRSCYGTYLTATSNPFLPGVTGKKVIQASPTYCDPTTKWQPLRDGMQVRLKSFWGNFLRPHGGLPPWRGSITHDVPHRPKTHDKILWDIEVVEKCAPMDQIAAPPQSNESKTMRRMRSRSFSASMSFKVNRPFNLSSQAFNKSMISY